MLEVFYLLEALGSFCTGLVGATEVLAVALFVERFAHYMEAVGTFNYHGIAPDISRRLMPVVVLF